VNNIRYNSAGKIARIFIDSKLTPLVIMTCLAAGIIALLITPREENPRIIVPGASIVVTFPGATALEVEHLVTNPMESIIKQIPGVDHITSTSTNSLSVINVQFEVGEDKEKSLVKLYDRIWGSTALLPQGIERPLIRSLDVDDVPIVTITLHSGEYDDYALKRIAESLLTHLRSIDGISTVSVQGGTDREIRVELNPEKLLSFGVTIEYAIANLMQANRATSVGTFVSQETVKNVFLDGFLTSADDVKKLTIGTHQGRLIYVEDVAQVFDGPRKNRATLSRLGWGPADPRQATSNISERPAVTVAIAKQTGKDSVVVANSILERIERIESGVIPPGVELDITRNDGKKSNDSVNTLIEHLGIAILTVFFVLLFFLGVKEAFIVSATIPLILSITLSFGYLFDQSINRITLFALVLSLGMLVDSSIVVIENIHRRYTEQKKPLYGADKRALMVMATNEIGNPTNLATLAVMAVFTSMILLTGLPYPFFFPITFNVPIVMFASIMIAYIVVPWACNRWLGHSEGHTLKDLNTQDLLHKIYYYFSIPLIRKKSRRTLLLFLTVFLLIASFLQPLWQVIRPDGIGGPLSAGGVSIGLLPKNSKNTFNITIDMPENTPVEITDAMSREIGAVLQNEQFILNYQVWVGQTGIADFNSLFKGTAYRVAENIAEIRVNLTSKHERSTTSIEMVKSLRNKLLPIQKKYPGSVIKLIEDPPGPPVLATVVAEIYGQDLVVLRELADNIKSDFQNTYDMVDIDTSTPSDVHEVVIIVDKEKAAISGISTGQIQQTLAYLIKGSVVAASHIPGEKRQVPIRLVVPRQYLVDPSLLHSVYVSNSSGQKIAVSELVQIEKRLVEHPIYHKDSERVVYVSGELRDSAQFSATLDLNQRLNQREIPDNGLLQTANLNIFDTVPDATRGYQLLWGGEMRLTLDVFRDLGAALCLTLISIFLLLIAYYKSFRLPLIAMAAIPLGLIGVFPGHWLMGEMFSGASLIGVIALAGVVVRNSLLIIDLTLQNIENGMSPDKAVIEAGATRFRPILLTALAIVLGTAIMLSDPVFTGLAISLIFGTITATVLTLLIIPMLLYLTLADDKSVAASGEVH